MSKFEIFDRVDTILYNNDAVEFLDKKERLGYKFNTKFIMDLVKEKSIYINFVREFVNEFKKQGNNINQIAKRLNSSSSVTEEDRNQWKRIEENQEILKNMMRERYANK